MRSKSKIYELFINYEQWCSIYCIDAGIPIGYVIPPKIYSYGKLFAKLHEKTYGHFTCIPTEFLDYYAILTFDDEYGMIKFQMKYL